MGNAATQTAAGLREQFQSIPKPDRDAHQAFSIRVWRGLSWLEKAEVAGDIDNRFIALWIAFNAIYGQTGDDGRDAPDHGSWQSFLARMVEKDVDDRLGRLLSDQQTTILHMIDNQFLFRPFWQGLPDAKDKLRRAVQKALLNFRQGHTLPLLQELFERLYVLRLQVFHGAATSGSKLNRAALEAGAHILARVIPAMIEVVIAAGPIVDWGEVCFPPIATDNGGRK